MRETFINPQGEILASVGRATVTLWEVRSVKLLRMLDARQGPVFNIAPDPTRRILASAGGDKTVKLWDIRSGKPIRTLEGHSQRVRSPPQGMTTRGPAPGYIVAAEVDMLHDRLLGTEAEKQTILPVLLDGDKKTSLPGLLHGRVHADFRDDSTYFPTAFDLILSVYQIPVTEPAVVDLRESLRGGRQ